METHACTLSIVTSVCIVANFFLVCGLCDDESALESLLLVAVTD